MVTGFPRRRATMAVVLLSCLIALLALGPSGPAAAGRGDGVVTDRLDEKAALFRKWLPLALKGDAYAQFEVGLAYVTGRSEPEDLAEGARWLRKAAEQGFARAQSSLGMLYQKGLGVKRDYVEAYVWLDLAAAQYEQGLRREQILEIRNMMAAFLTPEQRAEAKRLAAERKAAADRAP
jgi:TPR repeat protein